MHSRSTPPGPGARDTGHEENGSSNVRILVVKPSSFGDIVHALLVVDRIRSQLETARVDWVARDTFAPLVEASGLANRIFVFKRSPGGLLRLLRCLRRETFDVVLDMQGLARSGLMTFAARAKVKIGRSDAREGAGFFTRVRAPLPQSPPPHHAVEILRQFQHPLGLYDLDPQTLSFPDAPPLPKSPPSGGILLFPESRREEKEWPGFADLVTALRKRFPGHSVALCGTGKGPAPLPDSPDGGFLDLRGRVPLGSLPHLVGESAVVVANDSGPVHLAAAMGRPVVAVYGPTDPVRFGPYPPADPANRVLRAPQGDLDRLGVDQVAAAVSEALAPR